MRVVAGRFGGRRLTAPPGRGTRPTADRVREAVFSMLGPLDGERVLDLYAGSGALAIEALSRGARSALLVERDRRAVGVIRANLDALGLAEPDVRVHAGTARSALENASERGDTYDLVFVDPPYRSAPELGRELSAAVGPLLAAGGRVVTESDRRAPLALDLPLTHERRYGDTLIRIHSNAA